MKRVFENPESWLEANQCSRGLFKYVRFQDGVVLFCDACERNDNHDDIARTKPDVPPISAGKIEVRRGKWNMGQGGSYTLNLGAHPDDHESIAKALEDTNIEYDPNMLTCF